MEPMTPSSLKTRLPLIGLGLLYLVTRLIGLTDLPIRSGEAAWIHWAQIILQYPNAVFIAADNGEPPLFTWLAAVTLNLSSDPLWAGRLVSVLAGLASVTGLYLIGRDIFNRVIGILAAFIYILLPSAYVFNRLALPASLLLALAIWALRWTIHIVQDTRPRAFEVSGIMLGAALLTQAHAVFLLPLPLIVFYVARVHRRPEFWKSFGICAGIALAMNLPILLNASYYKAERPRVAEAGNSGSGVREAAQYLAQEAEAFRKKTGIPLPLLLPMHPGNPAEGITVYLWKHPDVRFVPVFWWPESPQLIPSGLRFSHRPSIYLTSPVMRRETTLLDYAYFIFPGADYSRDQFLQENPLFKKVWEFSKAGPGGLIEIYRNHPKVRKDWKVPDRSGAPARHPR